MTARDPRPTTVYLLREADGLPVYVGTTSLRPWRRLAVHRYKARRLNRTPLQRWLHSLLARGSAVELVPVAAFADRRDALAREAALIRELPAQGFPLLNVTGAKP